MSLFHFLPDNFAQLDPLNAPVKFTKLFIGGREREGRLKSGTYILQSFLIRTLFRFRDMFALVFWGRIVIRILKVHIF